jgi:putative membrane protein
MLRVFLLTMATLGSVGVSVAQDRAPTVPETIVEGMEVVDPLAFQVTAAAWNSFVIRASQLALERSRSSPVREVSSRLIEQHAELMPALSLASQSDGLPTAPVEGLDGRQSGMLGKLEAAPDTGFDRLFLEMQEAGLQESIGLFKGYAENGKGSLRVFATEKLPLLEAHRQEIEGLIAAETPS